MTQCFELSINTKGRKAVEITQVINKKLLQPDDNRLVAHMFVKHTSASLIITGNEDPNLLVDIENYLQKNIIDADSNYKHNNEGDFDTSGHIRTILTGESKTIPIANKELNLGKYQGLFLYEHRAGENSRNVVVTVL